MVQTAIALTIVAACVAYLAWVYARIWAGKDDGACSSCAACGNHNLGVIRESGGDSAKPS